jgi:hypothetical protein
MIAILPNHFGGKLRTPIALLSALNNVVDVVEEPIHSPEDY